MATRTITQLVSDLSGEEISEGKGETIEFAYRGSTYSIDLTAKEAAELDKSMAVYVEHASRPAKRRSSRGTSHRGASDAKTVRAWAKSRGIAIPDRGRIPADVRAQYEAS